MVYKPLGLTQHKGNSMFEQAPLASEPRKLTLAGILDMMNRVDEGLEQPDIGIDLVELIGVKVDSYKAVMDRMDEQIKELGLRLKRLRANRESIEQLMVRHMVGNGFERLPGNDWDAVIKYSERCVPLRDPSAVDALTYPTLTKTKIEWSISTIKDAIKLGGSFDFAQLVKAPNLNFKAKKG